MAPSLSPGAPDPRIGASPWEAWPAPAPPGRPQRDLEQRPLRRRTGHLAEAAGSTGGAGWPRLGVEPRRRPAAPAEDEEGASEPWWIRQPQAISLLAAAVFSALYLVDQLALVFVALLGLGLLLLRSLWNAD
ncbi:MAG: hypothetical protein J2P45_29885 [Candidatus Dormibacteraeota bacterium]|nr:hypothetical protein [Candidatus Dormibacteraeota bacterium]